MNSQVKILVVSPYFYPRIGGLENYAYNISKGLKEKYNWEVVVVTSNHKEKKYLEEKISGIKVYRLPYWFVLSNTPINPMWYFQIRKIIKKEKPDVINAHTPVPFMADIAVRVSGKIPFIITYHTGEMKLKGRLFIDSLIKFYESFILKQTLKRSGTIICSSDFVKSNFLKDYSNKTVTITPGVDMNRFIPKKTNIKNKVLFVGSLKKADTYKGLDTLLYSIKLINRKINDVKLEVVGDGDFAWYYKKLSSDLGIRKNVTFSGTLHGKRLIEKYQNCTVLVLPSLFESCPVVFLEAMACKKPLVGTNICGIPDVIKNGKNGLLFPPRNSNVLAEVIIKILKRPNLARQMGENGHKKVRKNFTWSKQIEKTMELVKLNYIQ